jgi:hypothetical protein
MAFWKRENKPVLDRFQVIAQSPCGNFHLLVVADPQGLPEARILDSRRERVTPPKPLDKVLGHGHGYWEEFHGDVGPVRDVARRAREF